MTISPDYDGTVQQTLYVTSAIQAATYTPACLLPRACTSSRSPVIVVQSQRVNKSTWIYSRLPTISTMAPDPAQPAQPVQPIRVHQPPCPSLDYHPPRQPTTHDLATSQGNLYTEPTRSLPLHLFSLHLNPSTNTTNTFHLLSFPLSFQSSTPPQQPQSATMAGEYAHASIPPPPSGHGGG